MGNPPQIGKTKEEIINDLENLRNIDSSKLIMESESEDYKFVLSNFYKVGSSCNQFFPSLYEVIVDTNSLLDILKDDKFKLRWLRVMVRNLKQDYLYQFSKKISDKNNLPTPTLETKRTLFLGINFAALSSTAFSDK